MLVAGVCDHVGDSTKVVGLFGHSIGQLSSRWWWTRRMSLLGFILPDNDDEDDCVCDKIEDPLSQTPACVSAA